eukprot:GAHX01001719.1.p1 GENE.GAHX01001719.1~~GAHX01001719.1.p1  ORF type:complete len:275 (-),score=32.40 GAHX01001719.1:229-1053(-)
MPENNELKADLSEPNIITTFVTSVLKDPDLIIVLEFSRSGLKIISSVSASSVLFLYIPVSNFKLYNLVLFDTIKKDSVSLSMKSSCLMNLFENYANETLCLKLRHALETNYMLLLLSSSLFSSISKAFLVPYEHEYYSQCKDMLTREVPVCQFSILSKVMSNLVREVSNINSKKIMFSFSNLMPNNLIVYGESGFNTFRITLSKNENALRNLQISLTLEFSYLIENFKRIYPICNNYDFFDVKIYRDGEVSLSIGKTNLINEINVVEFLIFSSV